MSLTPPSAGQGAPNPPIGGRIDWRLALVVYVRVLAITFLASGVHNWAILLGPLAPGGDFLALPIQERVAVGYFAVADLVGAVGLWLLASWGTVVWLIAALTEAVLHAGFDEIFGADPKLVAFHGATVVVYGILTWAYERTRDG